MADFTVVNTNNAGAGSLRQAILDANAAAGEPHRILFNIGGGGTQTIAPTAALPALQKKITIDGRTQPNYVDDPLIVLDGTNAGMAVDGVTVTAAECHIIAVQVVNYGGNGIVLKGPGSSSVESCFIGTNGLASKGNEHGLVLASPSNTVGGPNRRNIISGNRKHGVLITDEGSSVKVESNIVTFNYIGTNKAGTQDVGNGDDGVHVKNKDGKNEVTANVISANKDYGVQVSGSSTNKIELNKIGTDETGANALGNSQAGVRITVPENDPNAVSSANSVAGNTISANGNGGVELTGVNSKTSSVRINKIGTRSTGLQALGNKSAGILINKSPDNTIENNVIAANEEEGIVIFGNPAPTNNSIKGNLIGAQSDRTPLINGSHGIHLLDARNTVIGAAAAPGQPPGNLIYFKKDGGLTEGIREVRAPGTVKQGNDVQPIAPQGQGQVQNPESTSILVLDSPDGLVGGLAPGEGNVLGGRLVIRGSQSTGTRVEGNFIGVAADGTTSRGNDGHGVLIDEGASNNRIGGTDSGAPNIIAKNGQAGVYVVSGTGNAVLSNSIFDNGQLGIDLAPQGVTLNDPADPDAGPNNLQNFPVLTSAVYMGPSITITGTLNSTPNTQFTVQFFNNDQADPTGYGEGRWYLGSTGVLTDGAGNGSFVAVLLGIGQSFQFITATATDDPNNNTSEFSLAIAATPQ